MKSSSGVTGARDQSPESSQSDWSTKFCKLFWRVADKHTVDKFSQESKRPLQVTSAGLKKLELCCEL